MSKQILPFCLLILLFNCAQDPLEQIDKNELFFEDISHLQKDSLQHPYNLDNTIYRPGLEFWFKYSYTDSIGVEYMFSREGYELTPKSIITPKTIIDIGFTVEPGTGVFGEDYDQTLIDYHYITSDEEDLWPRPSSGIVENDVNVWMHPFRSHCYFQLTQYAPYPYIKRNLEVGEKWRWELKTGNNYDCASWGTFEGVVLNEYEYQIIEKGRILETDFGDLECVVVEAIGISDLGPTKLISYFNEKLGFVRLEYETINQAKMVIEMVNKTKRA